MALGVSHEFVMTVVIGAMEKRPPGCFGCIGGYTTLGYRVYYPYHPCMVYLPTFG